VSAAAGIAPLTGVPVIPEQADLLTRPAVVVKIENSNQSRPQTGLELADVVIEELVEGGITRFLAVFHSQIPGEVGNVRSARNVDADLVPAFGAAMAFSGAAGPTLQRLTAAGILQRTHDHGHRGFYRAGHRRAPHNVYLRLADMVGDLATAGVGPPNVVPWIFDPAVPAGAPGREVIVPMSGRVTAGWHFDDAHGVYRRTHNGAPHTVTGELQIGAATVAVVQVRTHQGACCDASGTALTETTVVGEGPVFIFRNGVAFEGRWVKPTPGEQFQFYGPDDSPIPLQPGKVWIELSPNRPTFR
jgi:hypothetical protein